MTEQEILNRQQQNGNQSFYLMLFRRVLQRVSPQWYRHVWFSRRGRRVKAVQRVDY